jgi:amino acid transporter
MASGKNQFGAFGGVFTPSILTILGVIMYLRLPWVVGQAGLYTAVGIVLAAHIISVTTGLSISSIATDKKVGAGGPYYIVSRSLGLPIGGTLGLALFIGLSFSISLYIIGFCESLLTVLGQLEYFEGLGPTPNAIRVAGVITLVLLTVITFLSTTLALKTQFIILGLIILSLISVGFSFVASGAPTPPATPALELADGAPSIPVLFGIFFPAVTGFTAGVNMSGDLKDPKKAIPSGTLAAIAVGLVTYVALAVFLAFRVPREALINNTQILVEMGWGGQFLVTSGIWGATISSALGSILGAPRILQALGADAVMPRFFAKGAGPTNEPRRALAIAFAIALAGILIGELNVIAAVVSIFFIATYGFLNLSCAIESWASTDFRPDFKIPRLVSVIGAITCVVIMIQLDLASTLASVVLFLAVFSWLKRRELALESGDTWEGVWSSVVRWGLEKLTRGGGQARNWRPNILAFAPAGNTAYDSPLREFGEMIIRDRGVMTSIELVKDTASGRRSQNDVEDNTYGVLFRKVPAKDRLDTIEASMRLAGLPGIEPNTLLLDWREHEGDPERFLKLFDRAAELDTNLLLMHSNEERGLGKRERIDIWWGVGRGSVPLSLSLVRFLTASDEWRNAAIRFLFITDDSTRVDTLIKTTERLLTEARVTAQIKVLDNSMGELSYEDWVRRESADADLVALGLPRTGKAGGAGFIERTSELFGSLGTTILLRGASGFRETYAGGALAAPAVRPDSLPDVSQDLPILRLPKNSDVSAEARRFGDRHEAFCNTFHEACIGPAYLSTTTLTERRHKKAVSKARTTFLFQARRLLGEYEEDDLPAMTDTIERRIEMELDDLEELKTSAPRYLAILRESEGPRHKKAVSKARTTFLFQARRLPRPTARAWMGWSATTSITRPRAWSIRRSRTRPPTATAWCVTSAATSSLCAATSLSSRSAPTTASTRIGWPRCATRPWVVCRAWPSEPSGRSA